MKQWNNTKNEAKKTKSDKFTGAIELKIAIAIFETKST